MRTINGTPHTQLCCWITHPGSPILISLAEIICSAVIKKLGTAQYFSGKVQPLFWNYDIQKWLMFSERAAAWGTTGGWGDPGAWALCTKTWPPLQNAPDIVSSSEKYLAAEQNDQIDQNRMMCVGEKCRKRAIYWVRIILVLDTVFCFMATMVLSNNIVCWVILYCMS